MAKIRESAYMNDFVMFRNACEERKLKYTISHIERLKMTYNKQQDKEKLFFAVQHLSVPAQRKQKQKVNKNSTTSKNVKLRTLSAPVSLQEDEKNDVTMPSSVELKTTTDDQKLLKKRRSMTISDIKQAPSCSIKVESTRSNSLCSMHSDSSKASTNKRNSHDLCEKTVIQKPNFLEKKSLLTVERVSNLNKKDNISRGSSPRSTRSSISTSTQLSTYSNATRTYLEDKERQDKELLSKLINKRKEKETEENRKTENPKSGLSQLPSKEEWERQINGMKRTNYDLTRREQQEIERKARDRWRRSFENMKMKRLAVYQSKIHKSGGEESNTTFVKFLPKSQQAFYIKDVQFAQKFL